MKWWKTLVVDFDGTIVDHEWPKIGPLKDYVIPALRLWKDVGGKVVIYSARARIPVLFEEMKKFLAREGILYDGIDDGTMGKPEGIFIDDKALYVRGKTTWNDTIDTALFIMRQKDIGIPTKQLNWRE